MRAGMTTHEQRTPAPDDDPAAPDATPAAQQDAPVLPAGTDVRIGPDDSDEPQAGAAEPTD